MRARVSTCSGAAAVDGFAFVLGETSPDAVGLTYCEGVAGALHANGTVEADCLGSRLTCFAGRAAFAIGVEEDAGILATAGAVHLPIPQVRVGSGEPRDISHDSPSKVGSCTCSGLLAALYKSRHRLVKFFERTIFGAFCPVAAQTRLKPRRISLWRVNGEAHARQPRSG